MSKTSQTPAPVWKTIREWLEELPEPYRSQALANAAKAEAGETVDLYSLVRTYLTVKDELTDAIMSRDDDTRRIGEDMDKAEKALREAVGL